MRDFFHRLRYAKINSEICRKLLSVHYKGGRIYRIPFGPLKGMNMRYENEINFHAILGLWDLYAFEILQKLVCAGIFGDEAAVCDVGANIGVYSLWFSKRFGPKSRIYAFEPAPYAAGILKDNISLNSITNIDVRESACSDHSGESEFFIGAHHHTSSLNGKCAGIGQTAVRVKSVTLDDFFYRDEGRGAPQLIKMDIEGGAVFAFKGCARCIKDKRPFILIESHIPEEDLAVSRVIQDNDYEAFRLTDRRWVKDKMNIFPHKEGVWGTLLLCPAETRKIIEGIAF